MEEIVRWYSGVSADSLLVHPSEHHKRLIDSLKSLFDSSVKLSSRPFGPLSELITNGLDSESVWEEIQTRNRPIIRFLKAKALKLQKSVEEREAAKLNALNEQEEEDTEDEEDESELEAEVEEEDEEDVEESEEVGEEMYEEDDDEEDSEEDEGEEDEEDEDDLGDTMGEDFVGDQDEPAPTSAKYNKEEDEMEAFLDRTDALEERYHRRLEMLERKAKGHKGMLELEDDEDEDSSDEDGVDDLLHVQSELYRSDDDEDDDEENEDEDDYSDDEAGGIDRPGTKKAIRYEDFFGPVRGKGRDKGTGKDAKTKKADKRVKFAAAESEEDEETDFDENGHDDYEEDEDDEYGGNGASAAPSTTHGKQAARMAEQISALERDLIAQKSWDLRGEVKGGDRPENSLLSIVADVDRSSKPAPIITQAYTNTIEEMIKKRIKDEQFDDVVPPSMLQKRKQGGGADDVELSQEKSKEGLGEMYANEFLKKTMEYTQGSGQLDAKRTEARDLFDKVCRNLDALSHFYYQPRPVTREAKITAMQTSSSEGRVSSISLEDIAPVTESTSSAAAPEELFNKKHGRESMLQSTEEMTSDDRQRLRRAHKASRKKERRMQESEEKLVARLNPGMGNKYEKQKTLEMIRNDKRVTIMGPGGAVSGSDKKGKKAAALPDAGSAGGSGGGSTALFKQLQEEARQTISNNRTDGAGASNKRLRTK